jgi:hypothetical protein
VSIVLVGRLRVHEVLLLVISLVIGLADLLGTPPAVSLSALLPSWEIRAWAAGMLASGLVGLVGLWRWRDVGMALHLEAGAMLIGAGALLLYGTAVFNAVGVRGLVAGGITYAWMLANLIRANQIRTELKET